MKKDLFRDSIKFKTGEFVCLKENVATPVGQMSTPVEMTVIYIIKDFYPDTYWNERKGLPGDSHKYLCVNIFNNKKNDFLQYQLCYASERISDIIAMSEKYLEQLKYIQNDIISAATETNT